MRQAVLSSYRHDSKNIYFESDGRKGWKENLKRSMVRCQWDPARDIYGNPLTERTIQLGIKGECLYQYVNEWITQITDLTGLTAQLRGMKGNHPEELQKYLPMEVEYPETVKE